MDEPDFLIDLWVMLLTDPRTGMLLLLLGAAAVCSYQSRRIPSAISGGGILFGLAYNAFVPPPMAVDWSWAWAGVLLALAATTPLCAVGTLGAGEVKLMAMVGAFLGAADTAYALLFALITAAALALLHTARRRLQPAHILPTGPWGTSGTGLVPQPAEAQVNERLASLSITLGSAFSVIAHHFDLI